VANIHPVAAVPDDRARSRNRTGSLGGIFAEDGLSANDPVAAIGCLRNGSPMRALFYSVALVSGAACSQQQTSEHELVMQAIETAVELPAGARALGEYSRNYALRPDGKVMAVYVMPKPVKVRDSDYGCEVMLEDFASRPCTEAEKAEIAEREDAAADLYGQANQSRWFDNYGDLPMIVDGGCDLIVIIFDPQSQQVESTQCNGEA